MWFIVPTTSLLVSDTALRKIRRLGGQLSPHVYIAGSEFPTDVGADCTRDGKERSIDESLASRHVDDLKYPSGRERLTCSPSELGSKWKLEQGAVQKSIKNYNLDICY